LGNKEEDIFRSQRTMDNWLLFIQRARSTSKRDRLLR